jgi:DNA-binding CsgD family transcriptional regulator
MPSGPGSLLVELAETSDVATVMAAASDTLRAWVGAGPVFLAAADPATGAFAGTFTFDIPGAAAEAFFQIEMSGNDVVPFHSLADMHTPVGSLLTATDGNPQSSARWREVISPLGWGDELRAAVRSQGSIWGYLCLHREQGERPFSGKDIARVTSLLPAVAAAMRRVALSEPENDAQLGTGVLLVDRDGRLVGATGSAAGWLDELGPPQPSGLPLILAGLVHLVLDRGLPVSSAVTTRTGRAGIVEVAVLESGNEPQVAVVISAAPPEHRLARLAAATGWTAREREIVTCVLRGLSTQHIADELTISPHTVQAHLTAVFAKTGLRSRRDLISRLRA